MERKHVIGLLIIACIAVLGYFIIKKPPYDIPENAVQVDSETLITNYTSGTEQGDQLYKDKLLALTGTVDSFGSEDRGREYVIIKSKNASFTTYVQCYFKQTGHTFKQGDSVILLGTCAGESGNIILMDSYIPPRKTNIFHPESTERNNYKEFNEMNEIMEGA